MDRAGRYLTGLALLGMLLGASSCGEKRTQDRQPPRKGAHWVHSAKLHDVMEELQRGAKEHWPQEIEDQKQEMNFRRADRLATLLAQSAEMIPDTVSNASLTSDERDTFMRLVDELEGEAGKLRSAVEAQSYDRMQRVLGSIQNTCNACHSRFRQVAGEIDFE